MSKREDLIECRFGKCIVRTWRGGHFISCPWLFAVQKDDDAEHTFSGVPNYCKTRHSAFMRGYYRAKWLNRGTYGEHYKPF